ncbi:alpha/beta fold hydrolase [Pseudoalteromonas denitrificans]|uniref:Proline iminopeptidase n=1 Tax=Pseudoalteromonas denitrificans DSM 6059 TaxID=1123010 RepID=A0A1I1L7T2_9GAMM|nr:alpha/beta hydrolase [Pseudoalteromonas denitrificans]SFC65610.1 Pimeloyl-ACP methyl ester carboxylesterase [Pseudoalteromonas denitrificans DSM 6059]
MKPLFNVLLPITLIVSSQFSANSKALLPYEYIGYKQQKVNAQMGTFKVPENRNNPNSRELTLTYVKFPTTSKTPGKPIVYLSGGPGGSATGTAKRSRFELFNKLRAASDVILFDQRGTGLSNDLKSCKATSFDLKIPSVEKELMTQTISDVKTCVTQWQNQNIDLDGYNTKQNAADLVDLAKTLNTDKINLWGISYGSHLAFTAAKYHPEIINQMVLASLEGLDHTIKQPARVQTLIEKVSLMLKTNPDTKDRYPNFLADLTHVLKNLETSPQVINTHDFRTKKPLIVGIGKIDMQFALSFIFLMDPKYLIQLPRIIADMKNNQFTEIASYIAYIKGMSAEHTPMSLAMDAASGISNERWSQVQKQAKTALVGRTTNFPFPDINAVLPVTDLGDDFRQELHSDIPTLFVSGTLDGRTLYQSQVELAANFTNANMITVEGGGHNVFMTSPEISERVLEFFKGQRVQSHTITLDPIKFQ